MYIYVYAGYYTILDLWILKVNFKRIWILDYWIATHFFSSKIINFLNFFNDNELMILYYIHIGSITYMFFTYKNNKSKLYAWL